MKRRGKWYLPSPGEEKIIRDFLPLVKYFAVKFNGRGVDYDDLVQAGSLGVLRATRTYDPSRRASFDTWASHCIEWAMRDAIAEQARLIPVPLVSLDQPTLACDDEGDQLPLHETIPSPDGGGVSRYEVLRLLVEKLPQQERKVVKAHYWGGLRLEEIARAWKVTRQQTSKIHRKAIQRLRKSYGVEVN